MIASGQFRTSARTFIDVRFSSVSRLSRDQIAVLTTDGGKLPSRHVDRRGVAPSGWLEKAQLREERASC